MVVVAPRNLVVLQNDYENQQAAINMATTFTAKYVNTKMLQVY